MNQFKVGDKVRCMEENGGFEAGEIVTVSKLRSAEGTRSTMEVSNDEKRDSHVYEDKFQSVDYKPKKPTHLVVWEESRDPCKFFDDGEKANEFVKELSERSNVKEDSILLIEIKSCKKIKVKVTKRLIQSDHKI